MSETPEEQEARARLATARVLAATTARRGGPPAAIVTAGVGLLVAGALAATYLTMPGHPIAFTMSFALYGAALAMILTWQARTQLVARRGFARTYTRSFALTITLYAVGIALLGADWPWPVRAGYCTLVALPMLVGSARMMASEPA